MNIALTQVAGRIGDHNDFAMLASPLLAAVLAERLNTSTVVVGEPTPALSLGWEAELVAATPLLRQLRERIDQVYAAAQVPVTALSRCAGALGTLPVVAEHHPDAVVVWFDAHADLNTPLNTTTGYLGGLALSGPLGFWDTGLGNGVAAQNAILVGTRDFDAPEQQLIDEGVIVNVPVCEDMATQLENVIAGRPVYVHFDCDVLEVDTVPTDYRVPHGMTLAQLFACAEVLARSEVIGIEIGELESLDGEDEAPARRIVTAFEPLFASLCSK